MYDESNFSEDTGVAVKTLPAKQPSNNYAIQLSDEDMNYGMQNFYNNIESQNSRQNEYGSDVQVDFIHFCDNLRFYDICKRNGYFEKYPPAATNEKTGQQRLQTMGDILSNQLDIFTGELRNNRFGRDLGSRARNTPDSQMTVYIISNGPSNCQDFTPDSTKSLGYQFISAYLSAYNSRMRMHEYNMTNDMDFSRGYDYAQPVSDYSRMKDVSRTAESQAAYAKAIDVNEYQSLPDNASPADKIAAMKSNLSIEMKDDYDSPKFIEQKNEPEEEMTDDNSLTSAISISAKNISEQAALEDNTAVKHALIENTGDNYQRGDEFGSNDYSQSVELSGPDMSL